MLFLLPFTSVVCFSPFVSDEKNLRGKVYARMELCQLPRVTVRTGNNVFSDSNHVENSTLPKSTSFSSAPPTSPTETSKNDHFFHIDLSDIRSTVVQIEAECLPTEPGQTPLKATYSLDTATIDWKGAHELLLFNDVSVLAFGYTKEQ